MNSTNEESNKYLVLMKILTAQEKDRTKRDVIYNKFILQMGQSPESDCIDPIIEIIRDQISREPGYASRDLVQMAMEVLIKIPKENLDQKLIMPLFDAFVHKYPMIENGNVLGNLEHPRKGICEVLRKIGNPVTETLKDKILDENERISRSAKIILDVMKNGIWD